MLGAVKLHCNFRMVGGGVVLVSTVVILRRCSTLQDFMDAFTVAVLPAANTLRAISEGSLCFTVQAENLSALKALWEQYQDSSLQSRLQRFLVTEEINQMADGQPVEVNVHINEQEYWQACHDLRMSESKTVQIDEVERRERGCRRSSDSNLYVKQADTEMESLFKDAKLELRCEREWRQFLEKENEELWAKLTEARISEAKVFEKEHLGESEAESWTEKAGADQEIKTEVLEPEKLSFVARYLENLQDTRSVTTEEAESGLGTQSAPSILDTEEYSEFSYGPNIGELESNLSWELSRRLRNDEEAYKNVCIAFGLNYSGHQRCNFEEIITQFSHTPVKLLKDVFETLQLYDIVELLENAEVHRRSLHLKGTMQEVKTLRKPDKRQTMYHSNVAVLIVHNTKESVDSMKEIETFFKNLNEENDVTIVDVDWKNLRLFEDELQGLKRRMLSYGHMEQRKRRKLRKLKETELSRTAELRELRVLSEAELRTAEQRVLNVLRKLWGTRKGELRKLDELSALVDMKELKEQIELGKRELSKLREKIKVEEREEERELIERQSELMETMGKLAELRMRLMKLLESSAISRLEMERLEEELRVGKIELVEEKQRTQFQLWSMETGYTLSEMIRMVTLEHQKILMTTPLKTVHRWFQTKEMSTFFVMFDLLSYDVAQKPIFEELKGLPNKPKLVVSNRRLPAFPEALVVSGFPIDDDLTAVSKTFTKRWETLDALSMMEELKRIVGAHIKIQDGLSSSIRFKKLQVKDSA